MGVETTEVRYFTKAALRAANEEAIRADRNRTIQSEYIESLSDDGKYPVTQYLDHNYAEARVRIITGIKNGEPVAVYLDIPYETYERLPTVAVPETGD